MLCNIFECQVHDICLGCGFEVMKYTIMNYLDYVRKGNWQGMLFSLRGVFISKAAFEPNGSTDALQQSFIVSNQSRLRGQLGLAG